MSASVDIATLLTGESATVTAQLLNSDGSAYATITSVTFKSTCGTSTITSPVSSSAGLANSTYIAGSCTGNDTITVTATVDGETLTATVGVSISAPTLNILMGRGANTTFEQGVLKTGTGAATDGQTALAAGGSTSVEATLVDGDNAYALYGTAADVTFTSPCITAGNATITSPVTTVGGTATTTYISTGCKGDDTITATATIDGGVKRAQQTITVAAASVGSVQFVSADPSLIAIAGTGGGGLQETSTLTFKVVDSLGGGVSGQIVNFSLNTTVGGIQLSAVSGVTQQDGTVQVTVQSGTIPTPVNVTATTTDLASGIDYSTQSDALVISTGRADQNSFSLSVQGGCNAPQAWYMDNVTRTIQILAADHFNNPVPDGTSISFRTEGGAIDGSCQTSNGGCTVTWRSQSPRPADGRATILATAIGNESYLDANSSGGYDDNDPLFTDPSAGGADMGEAWLDTNDNFTYDPGLEEYVDFNLDGVYTYGDGLFTGVLCYRTGGCSTSQTLHVREWAVLVMEQDTTDRDINVSGDLSFPTLQGTASTPATNTVTITITSGTDDPATTTIVEGHSIGQYPAAGTTIAVDTTNGTIIGPNSFTVPAICGIPPNTGYTAQILMQGDGTPSTGGVLTVTVTPPGGGPVYYTVGGISD